MRYLIIGASAAGLAAAEAILEADDHAAVTLLSDEPRAPYSRPLISYWLGRQVPATLLPLPSPVLGRVDLRTGTRVDAVDPGGHCVRLASGESLVYDKLLLATGATSKPLGVDGEDATNVFGLRTLDDAEAIEAEINAGARTAVVLGGGLVGVKAAQALVARGLETHLCVASPFPLSRNVDPGAGALVAEALRSEGIRLHLDAGPTRLETTGGRVTSVEFPPPVGTLACELVVRGKGVTPRAELFAGFGFSVAGGVPTDDALRTPLPDVWAAGDVALTRDVISGQAELHAIWPAAVEQGALAGRSMAGADLEYPGALGMNAARVGDRFVVAAGLASPGDGAFSVRTHSDPVSGEYRCVVERAGVLVGAVAVGSPDQAGVLTAAVRGGARIDELPFDPVDPSLHWGRYPFSAPAGPPPSWPAA